MMIARAFSKFHNIAGRLSKKYIVTAQKIVYQIWYVRHYRASNPVKSGIFKNVNKMFFCADFLNDNFLLNSGPISHRHLLHPLTGGPSDHHGRWHQAHRQGRPGGQRGGLDDLGQRLGRSHDIRSDPDGKSPGEFTLSHHHHPPFHLWLTSRATWAYVQQAVG